MSGSDRHGREAALDFARIHLQECAAEILVWRRTGMLPDGVVRQMAVLCGFAGEDDLQVAEALIVDVALRRAAGEEGA